MGRPHGFGHGSHRHCPFGLPTRREYRPLAVLQRAVRRNERLHRKRPDPQAWDRGRAVPSGGGRRAVRSRLAQGTPRPREAVPPVLRAGHEPAAHRLRRRQDHRVGEGAGHSRGRGQYLRDLSPLASAGTWSRRRRPQRDEISRRARQPDGGRRVRQRLRHPQGRHAVPQVCREHPQRGRRLPPQHGVTDVRPAFRRAVRERLEARVRHVRPSRRRARPLSRPRVAPNAR